METVLDAATKKRFNTQFDNIRKIRDILPPAERHRHTIKEVGESGVLRFEGKTWLVVEIGRYEEGKGQKKWTWYELKLFCLETGETKNLEWEEDDAIEVSITTAEIKFSNLTDDEGGEIDEDDLDDIVEKDEDIKYNGVVFEYDDDYEARYFRHNGKKSEKVYTYDFQTVDGTRCVSIEEWGSEAEGYEYQIFESHPIDHNDIEIISLGGGNNG